MNNTKYYITLDNGYTVDIKSTSAAQAMQTVLERFPGRKIIKCWASSRCDEAIVFDIPKHEAFQIKPKAKPAPSTCYMFNESEIANESAKALKRAALA